MSFEHINVPQKWMWNYSWFFFSTRRWIVLRLSSESFNEKGILAGNDVIFVWDLLRRYEWFPSISLVSSEWFLAWKPNRLAFLWILVLVVLHFESRYKWFLRTKLFRTKLTPKLHVSFNLKAGSKITALYIYKRILKCNHVLDTLLVSRCASWFFQIFRFADN